MSIETSSLGLAMNRITSNGRDFFIDSSLGIVSQTIQGFSDEVLECVLDFLHAKRQRKTEFTVKPRIALDVLKLAHHLNIKFCCCVHDFLSTLAYTNLSYIFCQWKLISLQPEYAKSY